MESTQEKISRLEERVVILETSRDTLKTLINSMKLFLGSKAWLELTSAAIQADNMLDLCPDCNGERTVSVKRAYVYVRTQCPTCRGGGYLKKPRDPSERTYADTIAHVKDGKIVGTEPL